MKALVLLADGFEDTEALCTADVLKRGGFQTDTASVRTKAQLQEKLDGKTGHPTTSAYAGLTIVPTFDVDQHKDTIVKAAYDIVVLPGGLPGATNLADSDAVITLLKQQTEAKRWIGAICAAPVMVLKKKDLLGSAKAVCYPALADQLGDSKAATGNTTYVCEANKIITSSGPATAIEFGLTIVATLVGKAKAEEVAKQLLYNHPY